MINGRGNEGIFGFARNDTTLRNLWMCFLRQHFLNESIDVDPGGIEKLDAVVFFGAK